MAMQWDTDIPIYVQLYQQVIRRILDEHLIEGEALPSVRKVASEYHLNPVTVSKAYQMLQEEEIVEKLRGKGLFIKQGVKNVILARERTTFIEKEWPIVLEQIARLQLSPEELLATLKGEKS